MKIALSPEELKAMEDFKEAAFKCVLEEIKSGTSSRNKNNLDDTFKQYGFTGFFTYLEKYYKGNEGEMLQAVENLWEEIN
jgi:hypothetical protein